MAATTLPPQSMFWVSSPMPSQHDGGWSGEPRLMAPTSARWRLSSHRHHRCAPGLTVDVDIGWHRSPDISVERVVFGVAPGSAADVRCGANLTKSDLPRRSRLQD